jgi:hypothetical protein
MITYHFPSLTPNTTHIGYARTKKQAYERMENLYTETKLYTEFEDGQQGVDENAPVADFLIWRDMRVLDGTFPSHLCTKQIYRCLH